MTSVDGPPPAKSVDEAQLKSEGQAANKVPVSQGDDTVIWDNPPASMPSAHATSHESGGGDPVDHDSLLNYLIAQHRIINDSGSSTTELWSASKIDSEISAILSGLKVKAGVETSTFGVGDITLSGEQTLNGLLTSTSRVLVTDQTLPEENGIYVTAAGAWSRATDYDTDAEVNNGDLIYVLDSGSTKFLYKYILVTVDPITVGTTGLTFEEHTDIDFGTTGGTAAEGNDGRIPIQDENDALVGTDGIPSSANKYVTDSDPRLDGGSSQLDSFDANDATFPATDPMAADSRNGHPILAADAGATEERVVFHGVMSRDYSAGNVLVDVDWVAATATSGGVTWGLEFERVAPGGQDIDSDGFAAQRTGTSTTNGTSGISTRTTITLTQAQADAIAAGDPFRLRLERVTGDVGDDMAGDAQVLRVIVRQ